MLIHLQFFESFDFNSVRYISLSDRNGQAAKLPMIIAIEEESLGASSCMDYLDTEAKRSTHESGNNVEVDPTGSIVHAQPPSNNGYVIMVFEHHI